MEKYVACLGISSYRIIECRRCPADSICRRSFGCVEARKKSFVFSENELSERIGREVSSGLLESCPFPQTGRNNGTSVQYSTCGFAALPYRNA